MSTELEIEVTDGTKISLSLDDEQVAEIKKSDSRYSIVVEYKELVEFEEPGIEVENKRGGNTSIKEIVGELEEELGENPTTEDIEEELEEREREYVGDIEEMLDRLYREGKIIPSDGNSWKTVW